MYWHPDTPKQYPKSDLSNETYETSAKKGKENNFLDRKNFLIIERAHKNQIISNSVSLSVILAS